MRFGDRGHNGSLTEEFGVLCTHGLPSNATISMAKRGRSIAGILVSDCYFDCRAVTGCILTPKLLSMFIVVRVVYAVTGTPDNGHALTIQTAPEQQ